MWLVARHPLLPAVFPFSHTDVSPDSGHPRHLQVYSPVSFVCSFSVIFFSLPRTALIRVFQSMQTKEAEFLRGSGIQRTI